MKKELNVKLVIYN